MKNLRNFLSNFIYYVCVSFTVIVIINIIVKFTNNIDEYSVSSLFKILMTTIVIVAICCTFIYTDIFDKLSYKIKRKLQYLITIVAYFILAYILNFYEFNIYNILIDIISYSIVYFALTWIFTMKYYSDINLLNEKITELKQDR